MVHVAAERRLDEDVAARGHAGAGRHVVAAVAHRREGPSQTVEQIGVVEFGLAKQEIIDVELPERGEEGFGGRVAQIVPDEATSVWLGRARNATRQSSGTSPSRNDRGTSAKTVMSASSQNSTSASQVAAA